MSDTLLCIGGVHDGVQSDLKQQAISGMGYVKLIVDRNLDGVAHALEVDEGTVAFEFYRLETIRVEVDRVFPFLVVGTMTSAEAIKLLLRFYKRP